jgi:hypothetical protein
MTFHRYRLAFRVFRTPQHPGPNQIESGDAAFMGLASSSERRWTAEPALAGSPLLGFVHSCPSADLIAVRPLQVVFRKPLRAEAPPVPRREDHPRRLAAKRIACSARVVSHHLDGLLRAATSGVLQPVPARVRCVAGTTVPHRLASHDLGARVSAFPAARAPFEEPSPSTAGQPPRDGPVPSCGCLPPGADLEGPSRMLGPLQGVAPSTFPDIRLRCCQLVRLPASFHGLLCLQPSPDRSRALLQT